MQRGRVSARGCAITRETANGRGRGRGLQTPCLEGDRDGLQRGAPSGAEGLQSTLTLVAGTLKHARGGLCFGVSDQQTFGMLWPFWPYGSSYRSGRGTKFMGQAVLVVYVGKLKLATA